MDRLEIEKGKCYKAKVIGLEGIRKVKVTSIHTNVVTCRDEKSRQNVVAKISDLEPIK